MQFRQSYENVDQLTLFSQHLWSPMPRCMAEVTRAWNKEKMYIYSHQRYSCVVRTFDCQCKSRNSPGFYPSILRHSRIWGAADKAVLNKVHTETNLKNHPCLYIIVITIIMSLLFTTNVQIICKSLISVFLRQYILPNRDLCSRKV